MPIVLLCVASDALLIFLGVFGLGTLLEALPNLMSWIRFAGALFLFVYGARSMISAWCGNQALDAIGDVMSLPAALFNCLTLTFLNPHVYLDTVILVGGCQLIRKPVGFWFGYYASQFYVFLRIGLRRASFSPIFFQSPRLADFRYGDCACDVGNRLQSARVSLALALSIYLAFQ